MGILSPRLGAVFPLFAEEYEIRHFLSFHPRAKTARRKTSDRSKRRALFLKNFLYALKPQFLLLIYAYETNTFPFVPLLPAGRNDGAEIHP
jgi:hypothetical protein